MLLLLVFVLFISLTSVSYAYTLDDLFEYSDQLYNTTGIYTNVKKASKVILDYETQIRTMYNNNNVNASSFVVIYSDLGYGMIQISLNFSNSSNVPMSIASSSSRIDWSSYSTYWNKYIVLYNGGSSTYSLTYYGSGTNINNGGSSYNNTYGLVLTSYTGPFYNYNLQNNYIAPIEPPQYSFIPYNNETVRVVLSNTLSGDSLKLPFSYNDEWVKIGYIENWQDLDGFSMGWGPILYTSGDETYGNTTAYVTYDKKNGTLSNGLITFMNIDSGNVFINTDTLYDRQLYTLYIDAHIGDNYFPIYLNGSEYDPTFYAYFRTTDISVPSNNSGISNEYYQSLPPSLTGFLSSTNTDFNDVQKNNIDYYLNSIFNGLSGDWVSGDFIGQLGYDDKSDNDFSILIYSIYRNILDSITSSDTNSSLTFNLHGNTYVFYASDFAIPSGPIKTFINTILVGGLLYLFYIQIHYIILNITTLDFVKVIKGFEHEHTFFM